MSELELNTLLKKFLAMLFLKEPFYCHVLSNYSVKVDYDITSKHNYWLDDFEIIISNNFLSKVKDEKTINRLVFHEVLHDILLHKTRRIEKNKNNWDTATDIVTENIINKNLKSYCGFDKDVFETNGNVESVYKVIEEEEDPKCKRPDNCCDNHDSWDDEDKTNKILKMLKDAQVKTKESSKGTGGIPSFIEEFLNELLTSKTSLIEFFNNIVADKKQFRITYKRLDRRYLHSNLIVPSSSALDDEFNILVYVDTSGSMDIEALQQIMSELYFLVTTLDYFKIKIIQGDSEMKPKIIEMTNNDIELNPFLEIVGRGGTDLGPFVHYLNNETQEKHDVIIIATDLFVYEKDFERIKEIDGDNTIMLIPENSHDIVKSKQFQNVFYI